MKHFAAIYDQKYKERSESDDLGEFILKTPGGEQVIVMGFGESEDPLADRPQFTRYRVFAGHCQKCGCAGRKLLPAGSCLSLICDKCGDILETSLSTSDYPEVTYVYWCNRSKFASDDVCLSSGEAAAIDELIKSFGEDYEIPHWAVLVTAGRCASSDLCLRDECRYLIKSQ